jgi:anti-anti-sigma factor
VKEDLMNTTITRNNDLLVAAPADICELVRGSEKRIVDLMTPVVRERNAVLDLGHVRRIDAAGIAALITIYGAARSAGNTFRVCNVTAHVAEILKLVRLDHILVADEEIQAPPFTERCVECPAA